MIKDIPNMVKDISGRVEYILIIVMDILCIVLYQTWISFLW